MRTLRGRWWGLILALGACDDGAGGGGGGDSGDTPDGVADSADLAEEAAVEVVDEESVEPAEDLELRTEWRPYGQPADYDMGLDFDVTRSGSGGSRYVRAVAEEPRLFGGQFLEINASDYRGQRVRLTVWIKVDDAPGGTTPGLLGGASAAFSLGTEARQNLAFDGALDEAEYVTGSVDWTPRTGVLDVPEEADLITVGVFLDGPGQMWFDDTAIEVVDASVASTDDALRSTTNGDFEAAPGPNGFPPDWAPYVESSEPEAYSFALDGEIAHGGSSSARITSETTEGYGAWSQNLLPFELLGQRIRLSALVATEDAQRAGLFLRIDGANFEVEAVDSMVDRRIVGTTEWTEYAIELDVSEDAWGVGYGSYLEGTGQMWLDDVSVEPVE